MPAGPRKDYWLNSAQKTFLQHQTDSLMWRAADVTQQASRVKPDPDLPDTSIAEAKGRLATPGPSGPEPEASNAGGFLLNKAFDRILQVEHLKLLYIFHQYSTRGLSTFFAIGSHKLPFCLTFA